MIRRIIIIMLIMTMMVVSGCGNVVSSQDSLSAATVPESEEQDIAEIEETEAESSEETEEKTEEEKQTAEESPEPSKAPEESKTAEKSSYTKEESAEASSVPERGSVASAKPTQPSQPEQPPQQEQPQQTPSQPEQQTQNNPPADTPAEAPHTCVFVERTASEATCTTAKVIESVCSVCGKSNGTHKEGIPLGHDLYEDWFNLPQCAYEGWVTDRCKHCDYAYSHAGTPLGCDWQVVSTWEGRDCGFEGGTKYKCSRCGDEKIEHSGQYGPHNYVECHWTKLEVNEDGTDFVKVEHGCIQCTECLDVIPGSEY